MISLEADGTGFLKSVSVHFGSQGLGVGLEEQMRVAGNPTCLPRKLQGLQIFSNEPSSECECRNLPNA